jgi:hypothetical protein
VASRWLPNLSKSNSSKLAEGVRTSLLDLVLVEPPVLAAKKGVKSRKDNVPLRLPPGFPFTAADVREALARTRCPITQAYLLPFAPPGPAAPTPAGPLEPVLLRRLQTVTPGSTLHLTLVEAVRRQYKLAAQLADRADKQAVRAAQPRPP